MRLLLGRLRDQQRRARRRLQLLAIGAAAALIAATAVTTSLLASGPATPAASTRSAAPVTASPVASASSSVTGVSASLGITGRSWGSLLVLHLRDSRGPRRCQLVVIPRAGQDQTLATWAVAAAGRTGQVDIYAGTYLTRAQISGIEVRSTAGALLLTLHV